MYDPKLGSALMEFAKAMPEIMAMVGMNPSSASLVSHMSAYLYGFIMLVFPMVFSILCANRLVSRLVDRGSMAYLLAAPVERKTVVFTQIKVLCTGVFLMVFYATGLGIINCQILFPNELNLGKYLLLNVGVLCLQLFIAAICFMCSCIFSDAKYSVGFSTGIPAVCFIIQMAANVGDKYAGLKYVTFFTLFDSDGLVAGELNAIIKIIILLMGAISLFVGSIIIFNKKDLSI